MIVYLITTTLLSLIGWILYVLLVRNRFSWKQQKAFILSIFLLSFLLPLILYQSGRPEIQSNPYVQAMPFGGVIDHGHLQSFCQCEHPDYTHRLRYRTNASINFLLEHKAYLTYTILTAVCFVLLLFILQLRYLRRLIHTSDNRQVSLEGEEVYLLLPTTPHSVGAFWLGKNYVIWQQELDLLTKNEQAAILRHELSHLRQKDTWLKALLRIVQCFWLINPAFYYFRKELDLLSECIADQEAYLIMPSPKKYAQLLIKVKEWQLAPGVQQLKGSLLQTRITRILGELPTGRIRPFLFAALLLLCSQALASIPLSQQLSSFFYTVETYEEIYHKVETQLPEAIYCQDCETVCTPIE